METKDKVKITIETTVNAPIKKVWEFWNDSKHITQWGSASDDWHTTSATNDLRLGGRFQYAMAAKDGSAGFDFGGEYTKVTTNQLIEYTMDDGRKVRIEFSGQDKVKIVETFEAEETNPIDMQRNGWQAILNNFKLHVENN